MALALIGARSTITSINDGSNEADQCALFYVTVLKEVMRAVNWNFAKAQIDLTELGNAVDGTSIYPWAYKYAYPSDCLKERYIMPKYVTDNVDNIPYPGIPYPFLDYQRAVRFEVVTDLDASNNQIKVILTNQPQAIAVYTRYITATSLYDDQFVMAFTNLLASRICIPVSGNMSLGDRADKKALQAINNAAVTDGNEGLTMQDTTPDWIRTRGYCGENDLYGSYNGFTG